MVIGALVLTLVAFLVARSGQTMLFAAVGTLPLLWLGPMLWCAAVEVKHLLRARAEQH
jgi:hypothetical protein